MLFSISELFQKVKNEYCLVTVGKRGSDGTAISYNLIDHVVSATEAEERLRAYADIREELVIIPTFYDDEMSELSPAQYAKFIRAHFGFDIRNKKEHK